MKILRDSSEDEMILAFLDCEISSARFGSEPSEILRRHGARETLIFGGDIADSRENAVRREIFGDFRGWTQNREMFERFPDVREWKYAECEDGDIGRIHYINYDYWNELSSHTGLPAAAAASIRAGLKVYDIPNDYFIDGAKLLESGARFKPIILVTSDGEKYILIEWHSRVTSYALAPDRFAGSRCYIGICAPEVLHTWDTRLLTEPNSTRLVQSGSVKPPVDLILDLSCNPTLAYEIVDEIGNFIYRSEGYRTGLL